MRSKQKILAFIYNSFSDPLFQSNLYKYLTEYQKFEDSAIVLITFEQDEFSLSINEELKFKEQLKSFGLIWKPLRWRKGIMKFFNFLQAHWLIILSN